MSFREEAEEHRADQKSGECLMDKEIGVAENVSGESEKMDEDSTESEDEQDSLCVILAETKRSNQYREMQIDSSSGQYNLEYDDAIGGEELEMIAVSRKPFKELSCSSKMRTNLGPESDREILSDIVCVKIGEDIHNPGEITGQMMALKEYVKAKYTLSDLIRAPKNDKMISHISKWVRTGAKGKGYLEEDSYKILSQFYKEGRGLLSHTADGVLPCKRRDEEKTLLKHNLIILAQLYQTELLFS